MADSFDELAAEQRERRAWHRLGRSLITADSYGLIVLLVVVTYVLSVSLTEAKAAPVVLAVQLATVWIALRTSKARRGVRLVAGIGLILAALAIVGTIFAHHFSVGKDEGALFLISSALYFVAPLAIVRHLILRRDIDTETLLGALAAYLLIGMFFGFAFKAAGEFGSAPFFGAQGAGTLSQDLFFSFVTLTTVGYGNLVPAANPGQTLAVAEAVIGQLFLIIALGKVVSSWTMGSGAVARLERRSGRAQEPPSAER